MMENEIDIAGEIDKDSLRQNLRRFTWQAYQMLPAIEKPLILDLGCGSGVPTIELAILSKGRITAVDIDKHCLHSLKEKTAALNLTKRVKIVRADFKKLKCRKESFDIVWFEGSIRAIGFENGLRTWRPFLKLNGFLVIHAEISDYKKNLASLPALGYDPVAHFIISAEVWFRDYFKPLAERISELKDRYAKNPAILELLKAEECEIEIFKSNPNDFASIFYIMRKSNQGRATPARR